jgi:Putative peptidoglycan binding domain
MKRTLMICMITALAALPVIAGAQSTPTIPEGRTSEGYLIPQGAEPRRPSAEAVPGQREAVPGQNMVREAQIALRDAGFDPGEIDGVMGPRTRAALREFQASQGLAQTGRLDAPTQRQLMAEHTPESSGRRGVGFGR